MKMPIGEDEIFMSQFFLLVFGLISAQIYKDIVIYTKKYKIISWRSMLI